MTSWLGNRRRLLTAGLLVSLLAAGCPGSGDGPKRIAISGKVTREGIPVDDGSIQFIPQGGPTKIGVGTQILNGQYSFDGQEGPPAGKYKVQITQAPLRDPTFKGRKNDAPLIEDTRFKKTMPPEGWTFDAEVKADQQTPIDFAIE